MGSELLAASFHWKILLNQMKVSPARKVDVVVSREVRRRERTLLPKVDDILEF